MINKKIIIASRSSTLAKTQTELVISKLKHAGYNNVEKLFIKSKGDIVTKTRFKKLGGKGLFTEEIDKLIINNKIHLGVHSAKDIPAILNKKLCIGAYIEREDVRDILITKASNVKKIIQLPKNCTLGTSSPRRTAYIKLLRPDLKIIETRGNIETRMRKVLNEKIFAIILAKAGLNRIKTLQYKLNFSVIPLSQILPAPGQGAIAITYNKKNAFIKNICKKIDCKNTRICLDAERSLIEKINGDCFTPIGAFAKIDNNSILLKARLYSNDFKSFVDDSKVGSFKSAKFLGKRCAESLLKKLNTLR